MADKPVPSSPVRRSRRGGPDREHMRIRRVVFEMIRDIARRDGLFDSDIARCCGTSRPRASNLLHGHIERFNTETLIDILARFGVTVDIVVVKRQRYARWYFPNHPSFRPFPPDMVF